MNEEKKNILAKLYTLRAGMSAISVRKDKVDQGKESIANRQKKYAEQVGKINNQISSNKINMKTEEYHLRNKPSVWTSILFIFLSVLLISVIVAVGFLIWKFGIQRLWFWWWRGDWFKKWWNNMFHIRAWKDMDLLDLMLFLLGLVFRVIVQVLGFILAIGAIIGAFFLVYKLFQWSGESISAFRNEKYNQAKAPAQIQALQQSNQKLKTEYQKITKESMEEVSEENKLIAQNLKAGGLLYKTLYEQYKDFLDIRDWQNVDLLIFYFETGRADTMKEALQEVDKQRRAEMIVQAVNDATCQICRTINVRMNELQSNITHCFSRLFDGLTLMHQSIVSQIQTGQEIQKMQLQSLTAELGNAVKQKNNQSTIALADDVHYLKTMEENAEVRRRNNP